jgi:hypothetical protein
MRPGLLLLLALFAPVLSGAISLSDSEAERIGHRLWQNESGGTVSGLTAWNEGEDFASLGIGHFIWYPAGRKGPFEESFPELISFISGQGETVPDWIRTADACPWPDRQAFLEAQSSERMTSLRSFLERTIGLQAKFAANRLENALPKMLADVDIARRDRVRQNFDRVAAQQSGVYALVDYVNFKGEGILRTERYRGEGWGLEQVLLQMGDGPGMRAFSQSAEKVLRERVKNSPPERREQRWLAGWLNRVRSYAR